MVLPCADVNWLLNVVCYSLDLIPLSYYSQRQHGESVLMHLMVLKMYLVFDSCFWTCNKGILFLIAWQTIYITVPIFTWHRSFVLHCRRYFAKKLVSSLLYFHVCEFPVYEALSMCIFKSYVWESFLWHMVIWYMIVCVLCNAFFFVVGYN